MLPRGADFSARSDYPPDYTPQFALSGKQLRKSVDKWIVDPQKMRDFACIRIYSSASSGTKVTGEKGERS
jgi:hypothetical protein